MLWEPKRESLFNPRNGAYLKLKTALEEAGLNHSKFMEMTAAQNFKYSSEARAKCGDGEEGEADMLHRELVPLVQPKSDYYKVKERHDVAWLALARDRGIQPAKYNAPKEEVEWHELSANLQAIDVDQLCGHDDDRSDAVSKGDSRASKGASQSTEIADMSNDGIQRLAQSLYDRQNNLSGSSSKRGRDGKRGEDDEDRNRKSYKRDEYRREEYDRSSDRDKDSYASTVYGREGKSGKGKGGDSKGGKGKGDHSKGGKGSKGKGKESGKGSSKGGPKGKGGRGKAGHDSSPRRSGQESTPGSKKHVVETRDGWQRIGGATAPWFNIYDVRKMLVTHYRFDKKKADNMCLPVGLDADDWYKRIGCCTCVGQQGHESMKSEFHEFPDDFRKQAFEQCQWSRDKTY